MMKLMSSSVRTLFSLMRPGCLFMFFSKEDTCMVIHTHLVTHGHTQQSCFSKEDTCTGIHTHLVTDTHTHRVTHSVTSHALAGRTLAWLHTHTHTHTHTHRAHHQC